MAATTAATAPASAAGVTGGTTNTDNTNDQTEEQHLRKNKWYYLYDSFTITVSLFDAVTDIIILIEYKLGGSEYESFYTMSLISLIVANFCYFVMFWILHFPVRISCAKIMCLFLCSIVLCPLIPFIMYFGAQKNGIVHQMMESLGFGFHIDNYLDRRTTNNNNQTDLKKFIKHIWKEHAGFVIEALLESLPQSIIQLTAMMYFNKIDAISVLSVLLSLISVSVKSIIFAYSIDIKTFLLQWTVRILDYIGVYFVVSWIFFVPQSFADNNNDILFPIVGKGFLYFELASVVPMSFLYVGSIYVFLFVETGCFHGIFAGGHNPGWCVKGCVFLFFFIIGSMIFAFLYIGILILQEIAVYSWFSHLNKFLFAEKVLSQKKKKNEKKMILFWQNCHNFVNDAKETEMDDINRDRTIRICSIAHIFANEKCLWKDDPDYKDENDEKANNNNNNNNNTNNNNNNNAEKKIEDWDKRDVIQSTWLLDQAKNGYENVNELRDISKNCDCYEIDSNNPENEGMVDTSTIKKALIFDRDRIYAKFHKDYIIAKSKNEINSKCRQFSWMLTLLYGKLTFFFGCIIYFGGRFFVRMLLPYYFLMVVWYYDIWNEIGTFQWCMLFLYTILSIVVTISFCFVISKSRYMFYIFPGKNLPQPPVSFGIVEFHYNEYKSMKFRESFLKEKFNNDIASVINQFVGRFHLTEEEQNDVIVDKDDAAFLTPSPPKEAAVSGNDEGDDNKNDNDNDNDSGNKGDVTLIMDNADNGDGVDTNDENENDKPKDDN